MEPYIRNRACPCPRCKARGLMGPAILITVGVLWLLDNFGVVQFDATWPAILIVVGIFMYLGRTASIEGHIQPATVPMVAVAQPMAPATYNPVPPPPPATPAAGENNPEVKA